ncbi:MAG: ATP-binding protein [Bacteroidota bacterium]|nr:ATP-binding protein [Bacteroidota bacterium]
MMETAPYYHLLLFFIQCLLIATIILTLFRMRSKMGLGLLYAALGLFQFLQAFLTATIYIPIMPSIQYSPGASILFPASLFAILLVYIKEDTSETRKIIYAIFISTIMMAAVLCLFGWIIDTGEIQNPYNVSIRLLNYSAWFLVVSTVTLIIATVFIILIYDFIIRIFPSLFIRIYVTMAIVLSFEAVIFPLTEFWKTNSVSATIVSGLISENIAALIFSLIFYLYLKLIDKEAYTSDQPTINGIYYSLSYRQKFEIAKKEQELVKKEADNAIQQSHVKYETLVNNAPVGVFLTDTKGSTTYVNPAWCAMSGISYTEALGYGWLKAVHPEDKQQTANGWELAHKMKESSLDAYRFLHSDGSIRWVLGEAVPEIDDHGNLLGYVGTITDITTIKMYEKELNIAKEKAEESDRLKTAFLQNISHEIRTPMNSICGFSEFLSSPDLTEEERDSYVSIIQSSSQQLLSIVTDILTISSLETHQVTVNLSNLCINNILKELLAQFNQELVGRQVDLKVRMSLDDAQSTILSDKTKLTQILSNLISNALKFTQKGSVEFGYNLKKEVLEFYVSDNGIGIKPTAMETIFKRFSQADVSIQENFGGTGLGLSISKGFVELLHGKIWVESEYGKGSTFYFTIPYNQENQ